MDNNDNLKSQTGGLKLMTVFIAVLALHVVVIGGFTVYHLMSGGSTDPDITLTDKSHKSADGSMTADNSTTVDKSAASSGSTTTDASTASTSTTATTATTPATTDSSTPTSEAASSTGSTPATPSTTPSTTTPTAPTTTPMTTPAPINAPATAVASTAAGTPAPTPTSNEASTTGPAPAPAIVSTPNLTLNASGSPLAPPPDAVPAGAPIAPNLLPPAEPAPQFPAPTTTLSAPLAGPVHMPPAGVAPEGARIAHERDREHEREHEHFITYTVKITDSYRKIAHSHHITVAELKEANHIHNNILHTGQKLLIPSGNGIVATTVAATDMEPTPTRTVMNESTSTDMSSLASQPVGAVATPAAPLHHHLYTIKRGDTLVKIARKFKTTPLALMEVNDIPDPARLTIGHKLRIPSHEMRAARIAPPVAQPTTAQQTPLAPLAPIQPIQPAQATAAQSAHDQPTEGVTPSSGEYANFVP